MSFSGTAFKAGMFVLRSFGVALACVAAFSSGVVVSSLGLTFGL